MQTGPFFLLLFAITFMLLFVQRTERKRRLLVALGMGVVGILIVRFVDFRGYHVEAQLAFVVALLLNFLFWVLIGRYNPPKSSDDMKVLGLDD